MPLKASQRKRARAEQAAGCFAGERMAQCCVVGTSKCGRKIFFAGTKHALHATLSLAATYPTWRTTKEHFVTALAVQSQVAGVCASSPPRTQRRSSAALAPRTAAQRRPDRQASPRPLASPAGLTGTHDILMSALGPKVFDTKLNKHPECLRIIWWQANEEAGSGPT